MKLIKMLRINRISWLCLITLTFGFQNASAESAYTINPGDILEISVWNEEALQKEIRVLPDGTLSFPLAGNLSAAGQNLDDIEAILEERLSRYLADPVVSVAVKSVEGNTVYVIGEVNNPGHFIMYRPLKVSQALSLAGGLSTFAKANSIKILRGMGDETQSIRFRYGEIKDGDELETDIVLQRGDVIVVP